MNISLARFAGSSTRNSQKPGKKLPEFAFIGRSNVGKSSLVNCLCQNSKLALTSSTPGKTKVVNHFLINDKWYLVDLPGYGYAKLSGKALEDLKNVVRDYIFNSQELIQLFVLIDSRHDIGKTDMDFLAELGENEIPFSIIFTKCDKQGSEVLYRQIEKNKQILLTQWESLPQLFCSSSKNGMGRDEILNYIDVTLTNL